MPNENGHKPVPLILRRIPDSKLTTRHRRILVVLYRYQREHGYWPSIRDLTTITGTSSTSVVDYNAAGLRRLGYAEKRMGLGRNLRPSDRVAFVTVDGETDVYELVQQQEMALPEATP